MKFAFEIIQTVCGQPDSGSYPPGLSHSANLNTCAMAVVEEFDTEEEAQSEQCVHDEGWESKVWQKHCPKILRTSDGDGGLDVYYIGPVSDEEAEEIHKRNQKALGDAYIH